MSWILLVEEFGDTCLFQTRCSYKHLKEWLTDENILIASTTREVAGLRAEIAPKKLILHSYIIHHTTNKNIAKSSCNSERWWQMKLPGRVHQNVIYHYLKKQKKNININIYVSIQIRYIISCMLH